MRLLWLTCFIATAAAVDFRSWYSSYVGFYPTLALSYICVKVFEHNHWYDRIDDTVILGALPVRWITSDLLDVQNVRGVLSMNENFELWLTHDDKGWEGHGVEFLQLPTKDIIEAPSQENIRKGIDFINKFAYTENSVYVHCKSGRSRSATVVACYLMEKHNWTPEEAVAFIHKKRPGVLLFGLEMKAIRQFYRDNIEKYMLKIEHIDHDT